MIKMDDVDFGCIKSVVELNLSGLEICIETNLDNILGPFIFFIKSFRLKQNFLILLINFDDLFIIWITLFIIVVEFGIV